jgi:hypothetical protein
MKFLKLNLFSTTKCHIQIQNHTIHVTKKINIEHYDLQSNFVIQSCNGSNQKSQFLEDENFKKSSYSIMMENFEYYSLIIQLNEGRKLIFDDIMHRKQLYPNTTMCLFLIKGSKTTETFTLNFIIEGLLRLYNRYVI